jgi:HlyD family secretion protein
VIVALLLAGGGAAAFFLWPGKKPLPVLAARVERVPELKAVVNASGQIRTEQSVDIQAEIAGVIVDLPVREGDRVKKGQVLLKIDPFQTETDVQAARSQLRELEAQAAGQNFQVLSSEANIARDEFLKKSAEVEVKQAETNLARSQEAYNRDRKLVAEKLLSPDQFEVSETQLKLNRAQVEAAAAKVEQYQAQIKATRANLDFARATGEALLQRVEGARSNLRRAEDLLQKTVIRSPLDGVVVKRNVEAGERAVPGILSNPQATLMTVADFSVIEAELKVDETDIVTVELNQVGRVLVDALPDTPLVGTVIEIGNSPINSTGSLSAPSGSGSSSQEGKDFKVKLRIQEPPASLRPGMSCEADITTSVRPDVLVIPFQSLTRREVRIDEAGRYLPPPPDLVSEGRSAAAAGRERRRELQGVFVCGSDERAHFRPVKTGITGESDIEVLEGLEAGDEVVVGPLKTLRMLEEENRIKIDRSKPFRRSLHKKKRVEDESGEEK